MVHLSDPGEHVSGAWTCPAVSGSYVDESSQLVRLNGAEKIKTIITGCGVEASLYAYLLLWSSIYFFNLRLPPSSSLFSPRSLPTLPKNSRLLFRLPLAHRFLSLLCLSPVISSCVWMRSHWSRMNLLFLLSAVARAQIWHHISDATRGLLHNTHTYFKFIKRYFILLWDIKIS